MPEAAYVPSSFDIALMEIRSKLREIEKFSDEVEALPGGESALLAISEALSVPAIVVSIVAAKQQATSRNRRAAVAYETELLKVLAQAGLEPIHVEIVPPLPGEPEWSVSFATVPPRGSGTPDISEILRRVETAVEILSPELVGRSYLSHVGA